MEKVLVAIEQERATLCRDIQFINQQIDLYRSDVNDCLISVAQFRRRHDACKISLAKARARIDALKQCSDIIVNLLKNE